MASCVTACKQVHCLQAHQVELDQVQRQLQMSVMFYVEEKVAKEACHNSLQVDYSSRLSCFQAHTVVAVYQCVYPGIVRCNAVFLKTLMQQDLLITDLHAAPDTNKKLQHVVVLTRLAVTDFVSVFFKLCGHDDAPDILFGCQNNKYMTRCPCR